MTMWEGMMERGPATTSRLVEMGCSLPEKAFASPWTNGRIRWLDISDREMVARGAV